MLAALYQHLNHNIVRNQLPVNQLAKEVKLNLGSSRETNLDFLKAKLYQHIKELNLLLHNHGLHQSLVSIPQVYTAPYRCFLNLFVRPGSLRKIHYGHSLISLIIQHDFLLHMFIFLLGYISAIS